MKKIRLSVVVLLWVVVLPLLTMRVMAANIEEAEARECGVYYLSVMSGKAEGSASEVSVAYRFMNEDLDIPAAYVINVEGQGFVIVSGSDLWYPILGYSTTDQFEMERMSPDFRWYFEGLCEYIVYAQNTGTALISDVRGEWNELRNKKLPPMRTDGEPEWLLDSEWGQGNADNPTYNKYCPYRSIDGVQKRAITGCVATAMSQIINYWQYPDFAIGDTLRYMGCMIDDTVLFGDIVIDRGGVVYDFGLMPDKLTSTSTLAEINAVALLCYHAGVSVLMGYGLQGSGAYSSNVPAGLVNDFRYDTSAVYEHRRFYYVDGSESINYTNDEWIAMLAEEIAAGRPIYYSGCDMDSSGDFVGGHAFVCDGHHNMDSNKFHFNWGWNGYGNMWCDVRNNEITVSGMSFNTDQDIVRYIQPRSCGVPIIDTIEVKRDEVRLEWTGTAANYELLYKEATAATWSDTIVVAENDYRIMDLLPETDYRVKIRALCGVINGGTSMWIDTMFRMGMYVPTEVMVTDVTHESVGIHWNSEGVATQWVVAIFDGEEERMDTTAVRSMVIGGLTSGKGYCVAVKSIDGEMESGWSDTVRFTTICPGISDWTIDVTEDGSAMIGWNGASTGYQLLYKDSMGEEWSDTIEVAEGRYRIDDLMPETEYMIKIRAMCSETNSVWSDSIFETGVFPCYAPTDVSVAEITYESVVVDWISEGRAAQWIVDVNDGTQHYSDTTDGKPVMIEGLSAGVDYDCSVRAICGVGDTSEWSDGVIFSTMGCSEATNLEVSEITYRTAVVEWDSPEVATWEIDYGIGIAAGEGAMVEVAERRYELRNLEPNTTYDVYVRLHCMENTYGAWSSKLTFRTEGRQGIERMDQDFQFSMYPNPTEGWTMVGIKGVEGELKIEIVDVSGRVVIDEMVVSDGDCEKRIDLRELPRGSYYVKVYGDRVNGVRKLIVR